MGELASLALSWSRYLGVVILLTSSVTAEPLSLTPCVTVLENFGQEEYDLRPELCYHTFELSSHDGTSEVANQLEALAQRALLLNSGGRQLGPDLVLLYNHLVMDKPLTVWAKQIDEWQRLGALEPRKQSLVERESVARERLEQLILDRIDHVDIVVELQRCWSGLPDASCPSDEEILAYSMLSFGFGDILGRWQAREHFQGGLGWAPVSNALETEEISRHSLATWPIEINQGMLGECAIVLGRDWFDERVFELAFMDLRSYRTLNASALIGFRSVGAHTVFSEGSSLREVLLEGLLGVPIAYVLDRSPCLPDFSLGPSASVSIVYRLF